MQGCATVMECSFDNEEHCDQNRVVAPINNAVLTRTSVSVLLKTSVEKSMDVEGMLKCQIVGLCVHVFEHFLRRLSM